MTKPPNEKLPMKTPITVAFGLFAALFILDAPAEPPKPNVLFIAIDDMND